MLSLHCPMWLSDTLKKLADNLRFADARIEAANQRVQEVLVNAAAADFDFSVRQ